MFLLVLVVVLETQNPQNVNAGAANFAAPASFTGVK